MNAIAVAMSGKGNAADRLSAHSDHSTAFTLAYGLVSPIFVALLPAHQQRAILLFALGLFILANSANALSTDFTVLMVLHTIAGIGAGVCLATGIAAAEAIVSPDQRGKSSATIMGGMASGTVLAVPLSVLLAEQLVWPLHYGWSRCWGA